MNKSFAKCFLPPITFQFPRESLISRFFSGTLDSGGVPSETRPTIAITYFSNKLTKVKWLNTKSQAMMVKSPQHFWFHEFFL